MLSGTPQVKQEQGVKMVSGQPDTPCDSHGLQQVVQAQTASLSCPLHPENPVNSCQYHPGN